MSTTRLGMFDLVARRDGEQLARWERLQASAPEAALPAQRERPQRRSGSRNWGARLAGLGAWALLIAAAYLAWSSGWLPAQMKPSTVTVRGADMSSAEEVLRLVECRAETTLPQLWWNCRQLPAGANRWLLGVTMQPRLGRSALLEVSERRPLVRVHCGKLSAWLCDDGMLVPMDAKLDTGERFTRLSQLPLLRLPEGTLSPSRSNPGQIEQQELAASAELLSVIACCAQQLPLQVDSVDLDEAQKIQLRLKDGFVVRLGGRSGLAVKLAALPKALRLCEGHRDKLLYLDASDSGIFYQKWKDTPVVN